MQKILNELQDVPEAKMTCKEKVAVSCLDKRFDKNVLSFPHDSNVLSYPSNEMHGEKRNISDHQKRS